ncbi:hypothetical protein VTK26DRAFT_6137 [Humicola hyalothermophila]
MVNKVVLEARCNLSAGVTVAASSFVQFDSILMSPLPSSVVYTAACPDHLSRISRLRVASQEATPGTHPGSLCCRKTVTARRIRGCWIQSIGPAIGTPTGLVTSRSMHAGQFRIRFPVKLASLSRRSLTLGASRSFTRLSTTQDGEFKTGRHVRCEQECRRKTCVR